MTKDIQNNSAEESKKVDVEVDVSALLEKIEALEKRDAEKDEKLKMLVEVADKGRVFNYENQQAGAGKKVKKIRLSVYNDQIIIGWRTLKDNLIKHPTTGVTVGEEQQYELLLLDSDGKITKLLIDGYTKFSDVRYTERIEASIVGQTESYDGTITFDVELSDGRTIKLDSKFIN